MAATHTGTGTNAGTAAAATSVTVNVPSGAVRGDVLLVSLGCSTASPATPATPSGLLVWEPWFTTTTSPNGGIGVWYRIVDGTEAASYSFTGLTSGRWSATADLYRGVDTVTPKDAANTTLTNNSGTPAHTAITTVTGGALVVGFEVNSTASGVTTTTYSSSNLTVDNQATSTAAAATNGAIGVGSLTQAVPGSVTPVLTPTGTPARGVSVSSALRPLAAPVSARRPSRYARRAAPLLQSRSVFVSEVPLPQIFPLRSYRRPMRRVAPRMSGNFVSPPPAQAPVAPAFIPDRTRPRRGIFGRRPRRTETVAAQAVVPPPILVPGVQGRDKVLKGWPRRGRVTVPLPSVDGPTRLQSRRSRMAWRRKPARVDVVTAQVAVAPPAYVPAASQRRTVRGILSRRGRRPEVVPPQQTVPTAPLLVPQTALRRALRGMLSRRGRTPTHTPAQTRPTVAATARRAQRPVSRRRQRVELVPTQTAVAPPTLVHRPALRRTLRGWPRRRPQRAEPVTPQAVVPPQTLVPRANARRTLRGWLRRIARRSEPPLTTAPPAVPVHYAAVVLADPWQVDVAADPYAAAVAPDPFALTLEPDLYAVTTAPDPWRADVDA